MAETPEACFFRRTNELRGSGKQLAWSARAADVAEHHSARMASKETIFHNDGQPPDDSTSIADELKPYRWVGENVGMGESCDSIFNAFLGSSGHKHNLLDPDYEQLGVGVTERDGTIYASLSFHSPTSTTPPLPPRRVVAPPKPPEGCR